MTAQERKKDAAGQAWVNLDTYSEFMEDEILFIGGFIDRNRELSQGSMHMRCKVDGERHSEGYCCHAVE